MSATIEAIYDGSVFRPDTPLTLKPNTRVRIAVEAVAEQDAEGSFLRTARLLNLEGPADWSENLDEYLYGKDSKK